MADPIGRMRVGDRTGQIVSGRLLGVVADNAALEAVGPAIRQHGMIAIVAGTGELWWFDGASSASAGATVLVPDDAPAAGRWVAPSFAA